MKKIFETILAAIAGMDASKVASYFNEDGTLKNPDAFTSEILNADKARIKAIKDLHTSEIQNLETTIPARVKAQTLTELENEIKSTFGIQSDKRGLELIKFTVQQKGTGQNAPPTEDEIKKSQIWLDEKTRYESEISKLKTEHAKEIAKRDQEKQIEKDLSTTKSVLEEIFTELNPVLPENAEVAAEQKRLFMNSVLEKIKVKVEEKDGKPRIILLDDAGKPSVDDHGNLIDFREDVTKKVAKTFVIPQSQDKGSPKPPAGGGATSGKTYSKYNIKPAKTRDEYVKGIEAIRSNTSIPDAEKTKAQIEFTTDFENISKTS